LVISVALQALKTVVLKRSYSNENTSKLKTQRE
jgi:multisubunit Na+/H+ antiporter MnhC subunit